MHGCGKSVKSERGSAPREGRQCLKLFIEERESYLIWTIYYMSFPEDFYSLACNSRFLYNRETMEIKDPRQNKTALTYCLFCFVCLFVRFVCLFVCLGNFDYYSIIIWLGHPHKMFRFPSPDRPTQFFGKVKKKIPQSLVKKQVL